jgi:hypothetical protein
MMARTMVKGKIQPQLLLLVLLCRLLLLLLFLPLFRMGRPLFSNAASPVERQRHN